MKKLVFCECGSGKPKDFCCASNTNVIELPFHNPTEYQSFYQKVQISSQFHFRYRGIAEFYGDTLIKYKLEKPGSKSRNTFLTVFGQYLTDYLEDAPPSSWQDIDIAFWEEFLFVYVPYQIKLSPEENEVEDILLELTRFTRWLDRKIGCKWSPLITKLLYEVKPQLKDCEHLLNVLFVKTNPQLVHSQKQNFPAYGKAVPAFEHFQERQFNIFEVTAINDSFTVLSQFVHHTAYHVTGLPTEAIHLGMLLFGTIGKNKDETTWTWLLPQGVYPNGAKKFLLHVMFNMF
ncbi:hypothetical protein OEV98_15490 [Caldibacillus lycopersici]|uniref:SEC-C domain-containing protein n=1 Tax=Perspicuibacillus lycopersici TaxID=1325689 RepID=A0AAE3IUQ5_9BACI|nr:hypothetical protein [Perspicuibacillus lycopersici]MCU9614948.1 hypothetical protein [Perspicuibacillus lycopersici]